MFEENPVPLQNDSVTFGTPSAAGPQQLIPLILLPY